MSTGRTCRTRHNRALLYAAAAGTAAAVTVVYAGSNAQARSPQPGTGVAARANKPAGAARERAQTRPQRKRHTPRRASARSGGKRVAAATKPLEPTVLPKEGSSPEVHVYPPFDSTRPRRITVMLHGMCHAPEYECPWFADAVRKSSWLVCPRASLTCEGGGPIWQFKRMGQTVEAAVQRVKATYPGKLDESGGRVLMGFSLGAIGGMQLAHAGAGKWSSVILIGAKVFPNARLLQQAGVERLLMVAGDYDMMKWHMYRAARRLERQGMTSRFMSLGKVGHEFPPNMNVLMGRALAWARGDDGALEAPSSG